MKHAKHTAKLIGNYTVYSDSTITSPHVHGQWSGGHTINTHDNGDGYLFVRLTINGARKKWMLHKLMAELFLESRPSNKHQIRHLDGNSKNNRADNLAWGTASENAADKALHGRTSKGTRHRDAIKKGIQASKANAALIAAAPDLLAALHLILANVPEVILLNHLSHAQVDQTFEALAKATNGEGV